MGRLGSDRRAITARAGVAILVAAIASIQCDRSEESVDTAGSGEGVSSAALGSRQRDGVEQRNPPGQLIIEDLIIGDGYECGNPNETVTIHYRGTLEDGQEFDSSYARARPIVAPLNGLIKGWQEGLLGMKVGGKRRLTVPSDLAYSGMAAVQLGDLAHRDSGGAVLIPPGATLIFEIELLDVKLAEHARQR
jgi:FKBP-type peptidyl-prolyl cis-trans isomerase